MQLTLKTLNLASTVYPKQMQMEMELQQEKQLTALYMVTVTGGGLVTVEGNKNYTSKVMWLL